MGVASGNGLPAGPTVKAPKGFDKQGGGKVNESSEVTPDVTNKFEEAVKRLKEKTGLEKVRLDRVVEEMSRG